MQTCNGIALVHPAGQSKLSPLPYGFQEFNIIINVTNIIMHNFMFSTMHNIYTIATWALTYHHCIFLKKNECDCLFLVHALVPK